MAIINTQIKGGGVQPTGTVNIPANGIYDVSSYATADVQVPSTAPDYYIPFQKDANNRLNYVQNVVNINGVEDLGPFVFYYLYSRKTISTPNVDFSGLRRLTGQGSMQNMFNAAVGLQTIDMRNITSITGQEVLYSAFNGCTSLTSVDLSGLEEVNGTQALCYTFNGCTSLTNIDLSSLKTVGGTNVLANMCSGCTSLTSIDLSGITTVTNNASFASAFSGCTNLTNAELPPIVSLDYQSMYNTMFSRTGLISVDCSSICLINANYAISSMFNNCTALTTVDFSNLLSFSTQASNSSYTFGGCTSLTTVRLDNLTILNRQVEGCFSGCSSLVSISFPKLFNYNTSGGTNCFRSCTSLQDIYFPSLIGINTNAFTSTYLSGCTDVNIHLPSNFSPSDPNPVMDITTLAGYPSFGGTNTTILFDLPAVDAENVNLDYITSLPKTYTLQNLIQNTRVKKVSLKGVTQLVADSSITWGTNAYLEECDLSNVKEITTSRGISFNGCSALTTVKFDNLEKIDGQQDYTFNNCSSLKKLVYSSLTYLGGGNSNTCFYSSFSNTTDLEIYFPALTNASKHCNNPFYQNSMTRGKVHFPSNLNGVSWVSSGWGSATKYYDLPATRTLNGANSISYERNPKDDTATALAWYDNAGTRAVSYYTSGTGNPVVGDTIYSDDACTTAVTTISSIS